MFEVWREREREVKLFGEVKPNPAPPFGAILGGN